MSYDRWPPPSEPQRLFDESEDHLYGRRTDRSGYPFGDETAEFSGDPRETEARRDYPRQEQWRHGPAPRGAVYGGTARGPSYDPPSYNPPSYDPRYAPQPPPRQPGPPRPPRDDRPPGPRAQRRAARRRAQMRRRRVLAIAVILLLAGTIGWLMFRGSPAQTDATGPSGFAEPSLAASAQAVTVDQPSSQNAVPSATAPADPNSVQQTGPGTFAYAGGTGKVMGAAGTLRRFQVAVEDEMGQDATAFAAEVDKILGDSRSWIAGGKTRFQRVPKGATHEFVIYLATPATSEKMCAVGGLHTDRYTSCRLPGQVIINLARWLTAVPDYNAPLDVYQAYAINHEVGHQLGLYHEACPGRGKIAPVMQQQTLGLKGCTANGWPYVDGQRVTGPSIP
jgi:hypothetical protein